MNPLIQSSINPVFAVRAGQREFERGVDEHRIAGLLARRQYGKTTISSRIALKKMMRTAGHTVIFGSVKLDLGREIVRKESAEMQKAFALIAAQAQQANTLLDVVDVSAAGKTDKSVANLGADDFAELYEAQRLEFRLYHSRTLYSRTKVVALTPDAVGETGDVILDEIGRAKKFREVWEAMKPIISANPEFRCILTTTPPPDDTHYSFELLAPPIADELPIKPQGNWYRSDLGIWVLRITAWDAYADGVPLYDDDTGAAISPAASRAADYDKDAWDRNYGCKFVIGGTAAVGLLQLDTAQRRGIGECIYVQVDADGDLDNALASMLERIGSGAVGLGWDLATTTKETSNPSAFVVLERRGLEIIARLIATWKTRDPDVARERAGKIIAAVRARKEGGPARRLAIDATNERYFAMDCRKEFAAELPVELVIGSETIEVPGQPEPITMKQYLGGQLVAEIDDNHAWLPPERYIKEDFRLVKKEKGQFVCEPDAAGRHGDTFDGVKQALHALKSTAGAIESVEGIRLAVPRFRPRFIPRQLARVR
jgi:hypothetical protein